MYKINEDLSIYVTRGDTVLFDVKANDADGTPHTFMPGDLVRIKVYKKKKADEVVLQKDFHIAAPTQKVQIYLSKEDTKIGEVISKPVTYWYSIALINPDNEEQTIIGYDDEMGAKTFVLLPEGGDKQEEDTEQEVTPPENVDNEIDINSTLPVSNQAVARAVARLEAGIEAMTDKYVTPQFFGAIGDGESDDTEAFKKAIDCNNEIRIPRGNYRICGDILINTDNVKITGEGAILHLGGNSIVVGGSSSSKVVNNFSISGVEMSYGALHLKCINNFTVDNCYIHNVERGLVGSHCYNGNIANSKFSDCEVGVLFDKDILAPSETADHNAIFVRNCKFYNNTAAAFIIRGGFVGEFSNNAVEGNERGIVVEGMADFKIMSNYFEYNQSDVITLNNYGSVLNTSIQIGGNRIFGKADSTPTGMVLTGTIMGLFLQPNSWGGLGVLIDNKAILSGPVLLYQVNNTGKKFPDFINNMRTINPELIINSVSTAPSIVTGRMFTLDNVMHAHTKLGDYVLDYKLGYVPTLNTTPTSGDGLLYLLPDGTLRIKVNGVEKKVTLS